MRKIASISNNVVRPGLSKEVKADIIQIQIPHPPGTNDGQMAGACPGAGVGDVEVSN